MRFHIVMEKTIWELMELRRLAVVILVGLSLPLLLAGVVWKTSFLSGTMSLEMQTHSMAGYFLIVTFMWIAGIYIVYVITNGGMDFVSKEQEEGTLLLMVSKPIGRFQFILGKFLGLLAVTLFLELLLLFGSISLFWWLLRLDAEVMQALLGLMPWIFLYCIVISILFGAITIAISTMFRSRVLKTALVMLLIMFAFGFGPIMRVAWPATYESYHLYYIDPGYHLGNIFISLSEHTESGRVTPQNQAYLGIFTGTYVAGMEEMVLSMFMGSSASFDPDIGAMPPSLERTNYLSPAVSALLFLVVSAAALWVAKLTIERKEVH